MFQLSSALLHQVGKIMAFGVTKNETSGFAAGFCETVQFLLSATSFFFSPSCLIHESLSILKTASKDKHSSVFKMVLV